MTMFSDVQFYDYTKLPNRKHIPPNYHLTFSLADGNDAASIAAIDNGMNVAAVFRNKDTVARYMANGIVARRQACARDARRRYRPALSGHAGTCHCAIRQRQRQARSEWICAGLMEGNMVISEAAERVRVQLEQRAELVRDDVAELLEDYDALADTYQRVMKNLDPPQ